MTQESQLLDDVRVTELIALFTRYYPNPFPVEYLLDITDLKSERRKRVGTLSGGQKRRLGFALAMAGNPELIFLDEPTVGMDLSARESFWGVLRDMAHEGKRVTAQSVSW